MLSDQLCARARGLCTRTYTIYNDAARTAGTGFLFIQYVDDKNIHKGVNIIHSGSTVQPLNHNFSSMEAEAIALDRAITAYHHWLYHCPEVELISDCQGLLRLLKKHTANVDNRSLQQILIRAGYYKWKSTYIKGSHNRVADALSRLCKSICSYSYKYEKNIPRLMTLSTRKALRAKQIKKNILSCYISEI